ncbi:alcohol dehydrogenase, propanol-preferring [Desulfuromusa kysingii]|uniref:Alcohol dehydrogenase, propanol-preferring n=1 Tax=Desulfuromusa kysingii TaxID=37625 RepID=A0A1H4BDU3_9BACT|nr:zinc-dependent alcohol dehydrogenase family protein [Desulfuromusa kysingii]SEA46375.1 alcohol dehydrogenase, propanol-preferring [Desulfuromusa kysingii]
MKAMILEKICDLTVEREPLRLIEMSIPEPAAHEVRIKVTTCGVCHTELDEIEGRTPPPVFPMVLGHQVVGVIDKVGQQVDPGRIGERVGVAWIYSSCGKCRWCLQGLENLCPEFKATGRDANGGYAEYMVALADFAHPIPAVFKDSEAAPLLCAGAIGYRSLNLAKLTSGGPLGLTGFGASAHLVLKLAQKKYPDMPIYVFARSKKEQQFALELGADWAGGTESDPPELLESIIDTTPAWLPIVNAMHHLMPGGRLVINAIRKENFDRHLLAEIDYPQDLWLEKEIKTVANVTRQDVTEFLELAAEIPLHPTYEEFPLEAANIALLELKERKIRGAKVLRIG